MRCLLALLPLCTLAHADPKTCVDGKPFDPKTLGDRIAYLASEKLGGRVPGTAGDTAARAYIVEQLKCLGLEPGGFDGSYLQPFVDNDNHDTANVIGYLRGTDAKVGDQIIVIAAHHDHLGNGLYGANDNASGVVAMLAIAQAIRQHGDPKRTIAFVAFGAEEAGLLGSQYFVAHPPPLLPIAKIVQDINLDMVGSYSSKGFVAAMGTFPRLPARTLLDKLTAKNPKLHVGVGGRASRSDHLAFCKAGIPYVFFWTPDARCYHEACDTADKIDRKHMADIAALAGELAWTLAESTSDLAAARTKLGCDGR